VPGLSKYPGLVHEPSLADHDRQVFRWKIDLDRGGAFRQDFGQDERIWWTLTRSLLLDTTMADCAELDL
jgi:hypothetical protein